MYTCPPTIIYTFRALEIALEIVNAHIAFPCRVTSWPQGDDGD